MSSSAAFPSQALAKKVRRKYPQFRATYEKWEFETVSHSHIEHESVLARCSRFEGELIGALVFLGEGVQSSVTDFRPIRHIGNEIALRLSRRENEEQQDGEVKRSGEEQTRKACESVIVAGKLCFHSERPFTIVELIRFPKATHDSTTNVRESDLDASGTIVFEKCNLGACFGLQNAPHHASHQGGASSPSLSCASLAQPPSSSSSFYGGTVAAAVPQEWVVSLKKTRVQVKEDGCDANTAEGKKDNCASKVDTYEAVGGDFYVVRLLQADTYAAATNTTEEKTREPSVALPLASVAKLIAGCDGVPVVAGANAQEVAETVREALQYANNDMPHLRTCTRSTPVEGVPNEKEKEENSTTADERSENHMHTIAKADFLTPIHIDEVPGLYVVPNFITVEEEARIIDELKAYDTQKREQREGEGPAPAKGTNTAELIAEEHRGGDGTTTTPWEQLARRDVLHFSRRFFYDTMKVGVVGENVSGPNPTFYDGLVDRLCTGVRRPLWGREGGGESSANRAEKRPRDEGEQKGKSGEKSSAHQIDSDDAIDKENEEEEFLAAPGWPVPTDHRCDQLTVNRYRYDQKQKISSGIAQHVDVHSFFGDIVFSVSLLSHTLLEYERPTTTDKSIITKRNPIFASPRSLLIMTGESRFLWTHAIQHKYADFVDESFPAIPRRDRVSLTLRKARNNPSLEHNLSNCPYPIMCDSKV